MKYSEANHQYLIDTGRIDFDNARNENSAPAKTDRQKKETE